MQANCQFNIDYLFYHTNLYCIVIPVSIPSSPPPLYVDRTIMFEVHQSFQWSVVTRMRPYKERAYTLCNLVDETGFSPISWSRLWSNSFDIRHACIAFSPLNMNSLWFNTSSTHAWQFPCKHNACYVHTWPIYLRVNYSFRIFSQKNY